MLFLFPFSRKEIKASCGQITSPSSHTCRNRPPTQTCLHFCSVRCPLHLVSRRLHDFLYHLPVYKWRLRVFWQFWLLASSHLTSVTALVNVSLDPVPVLSLSLTVLTCNLFVCYYLPSGLRVSHRKGTRSHCLSIFSIRHIVDLQSVFDCIMVLISSQTLMSQAKSSSSPLLTSSPFPFSSLSKISLFSQFLQTL